MKIMPCGFCIVVGRLGTKHVLLGTFCAEPMIRLGQRDSGIATAFLSCRDQIFYCVSNIG